MYSTKMSAKIQLLINCTIKRIYIILKSEYQIYFFYDVINNKNSF